MRYRTSLVQPRRLKSRIREQSYRELRPMRSQPPMTRQKVSGSHDDEDIILRKEEDPVRDVGDGSKPHGAEESQLGEFGPVGTVIGRTRPQRLD